MGWNCGYASLKLCHPWDRSAGICLESTALHQCSSIATICCNCSWRIKFFTNCVEVRFSSDVLAPFSGCSGTFCTAQLGALLQTHLVPANPTSVLQVGWSHAVVQHLLSSSIRADSSLPPKEHHPHLPSPKASHSCLFLHHSQLPQSSPVG